MWGALVTGLLGLHRGHGLVPTVRHPILIAVLALSCAVMVQLIPLTPTALRLVSPATLGFVQDYVQVPHEAVAAITGSAAPAQSFAQSRPLSLHPPATITALIFTLTLGLIVAGGATGLGVRDAHRLSAGLLVLGVVVAFIAIVQRSTYNGRVLWFWESQYGGIAFGPFVNRNHFAGWMVMAISAGLGYFMAVSNRAMRGIEGWRNRLLWLSSPEASSVLLAGLALMVMGLALVLTASRSGTGCLVLAFLVVSAAAMHRRASDGMPRRRRMLMVGYLACLAFVTVVWTGLPVIATRFSYSDTATPFALGGRADLWTDAVAVIRRFPLTGTGLNTYTVVTPFFQTRVTPNSDEAHNDYLQLAAEGGLLVGIPAALLVVLFVREVRRRFKASPSFTSYWIRVGAVAGLVAMAAQESVEFSLQIPGNAVMFAALCAIAVHNSERE